MSDLQELPLPWGDSGSNKDSQGNVRSTGPIPQPWASMELGGQGLFLVGEERKKTIPQRPSGGGGQTQERLGTQMPKGLG